MLTDAFVRRNITGVLWMIAAWLRKADHLRLKHGDNRLNLPHVEYHLIS